MNEGEGLKRMGHNVDGEASHYEMQATGLLMPAKLPDDSLSSMIEHLKHLDSFSAKSAVSILSATDFAPSATSADSV